VIERYRRLWEGTFKRLGRCCCTGAESKQKENNRVRCLEEVKPKPKKRSTKINRRRGSQDYDSIRARSSS